MSPSLEMCLSRVKAGAVQQGGVEPAALAAKGGVLENAIPKGLMAIEKGDWMMLWRAWSHPNLRCYADWRGSALNRSA